MSEWRDIESAPWDGRFLAAYRTHNGKWICEVAYMFGTVVALLSGREFPATHWQPLPEPPK